MKTCILRFFTLILISSLSQLVFGQTSDYAKVEETLKAYLEGDTNKNFNILKKAFHPNATMKYVSSKSGYKEYNALEVFAAEKGRDPEKNRMNTIAYISITGKAAHAKLEISYPKRVVVDYVNLLKVNGEWKIVNKIFSLKQNTQN